MDSEYVRENPIEVLGVETEEAKDVEGDTQGFLNMDRAIDVLAVFGGIVIVALFAYIAYSGKEGK